MDSVGLASGVEYFKKGGEIKNSFTYLWPGQL